MKCFGGEDARCKNSRLPTVFASGCFLASEQKPKLVLSEFAYALHFFVLYNNIMLRFPVKGNMDQV